MSVSKHSLHQNFGEKLPCIFVLLWLQLCWFIMDFSRSYGPTLENTVINYTLPISVYCTGYLGLCPTTGSHGPAWSTAWAQVLAVKAQLLTAKAQLLIAGTQLLTAKAQLLTAGAHLLVAESPVLRILHNVPVGFLIRLNYGHELVKTPCGECLNRFWILLKF